MSFSEDQVPPLLEAISSTGKALAQHELGAREKLLSLSYALSAALETPSETIQRMGWAEPGRFSATRLAIDLKLFEKLSETRDAPLSSTQLASMSGADETLISRTMKHLCATNIVAETGPDTYTSTRMSKAFTLPKYRDGIRYCYDVAGPSFQTIPAYLQKTAYHNPHDVSNGPFQHGHNLNLSIFEFLSARPFYGEIFNNYMSGYRDGRSSWMDPGIYPIANRLGDHPNPNPNNNHQKNAVLLVDVGGGMGQDLKDFQAKHPHLPGRLILQDLTSVIAQMPQDSNRGFEAMAHDFFTPQPVIGANFYHLHSILHNWDDPSCLTILRSLRPALSANSPSSKLLIYDFVVPNQLGRAEGTVSDKPVGGIPNEPVVDAVPAKPTSDVPDPFAAAAAWPITSMDWFMMAVCNVYERTEAQWRKLLGEAGYRVEGIWGCGVGEESLIEAVVVAKG